VLRGVALVVVMFTLEVAAVTVLGGCCGSDVECGFGGDD
jgi:hypothetical protein